MLKRDVFNKAMHAGLFKKLAWLIGAFSLVTEAADAWKSDQYPWRIVQLTSGNYAVTPTFELELIEDAPVGQPVYDFYDELIITAQDIPNCKQPQIETTYGNWMQNWLLLVTPFGTKIDYMDGLILPDRIQEVMLANFHDNPASPLEEKPDRFYVREYLEYMKSLYFLSGMTQLCVWAATRKTMLPAPGINELKDRLLEEHKDSLDKLATVAQIDAELVKHDLAYLKGDPGMIFLRGGKAVDVVRKRKYGMVGAEVGLSESSVYGVLIKNSLTQGWEIDKIPIMNDTSRAGSYNRGAQTQLGGVSVKWLLRASANLNITQDDCGSKLGLPMLINEANAGQLVGFTVIQDGKQTKVNKPEDAGAYLGQKVFVRSSQYCRLPYTDFCRTCLGDRLSINPNGLSMAMSAYGNVILSIFLALMHGKKLATATMDYETAIS